LTAKQGELCFESIQFQKEDAMHPVSYLFEDVYRNYWGIPRADPPERRRAAELSARPVKNRYLVALARSVSTRRG